MKSNTNLIKQLPSWVAGTEFCPLKAAGLPDSYIPKSPKCYRDALNAWADAIRPHLDRCVAKFRREMEQREAFKAQFKNAPLAITSQFTDTSYRDPEERKRFYALLPMFNPFNARTPGFSKDNLRTENRRSIQNLL